MKGGLKLDIYKTLQKNLKLLNKEILILETAQEKYNEKFTELEEIIKEKIINTTEKFKNKRTTRSLQKEKNIAKESIKKLYDEITEYDINLNIIHEELERKKMIRENIVQRLEDYDRALDRIVFGKKKSKTRRYKTRRTKKRRSTTRSKRS